MLGHSLSLVLPTVLTLRDAGKTEVNLRPHWGTMTPSAARLDDGISQH